MASSTDHQQHYRHFEASEIPDGVVHSLAKRAHPDRRGQDDANVEAGKPSESEQIMEEFCPELERQKASGEIDAMSLARIMQRSDDVHYQALEDTYRFEYAQMTPAEKRDWDEEMKKTRRVISHARADWVAIARSMPEEFVEGMETSCSMQKADRGKQT